MDVAGLEKCTNVCFDKATSADDKSRSCLTIHRFAVQCLGTADEGGAKWDGAKAGCASACELVATLPQADANVGPRGLQADRGEEVAPCHTNGQAVSVSSGRRSMAERGAGARTSRGGDNLPVGSSTLRLRVSVARITP